MPKSAPVAVTETSAEEAAPVVVARFVNDKVCAEVVGTLVSRLDHPVHVTHRGATFQLPARGRSQPDLVKRELGPLPAGIVFVPAA